MGAQREQPLLRLFQQAGIGIRFGGEAGKQGLGLRQRFLGAFQRGHRGAGGVFEAGRVVRADQLAQRAGSGAQRGSRAGATAVPRGQLRQRRGDGLGAALALLQPLAFDRQGLLLAGLRRKLRQLVHGMAQPFLVALGRGDRLAGGFQRQGGPTPVAPRGRDGLAQLRRHAERIQQRGVADGIGQAHLLVLALHLHQQRTDPAQQGGADRLVVQKGAGPAILGQHAAQHDLILGLQPLLGEQGGDGMTGGREETCGDRGLLGAAADQPDIGARAEREAEAVEQDGLARAGFAGEHGKAGTEAEIQLVDQHHIADGQCCQHAGSVRSSASREVRKSNSRRGRRTPAAAAGIQSVQRRVR